MSIFAFLFVYINCLYLPQCFSIAVFFLIIFSIISGKSAPTNNHTLAKVDFNISTQHTYLKKLGMRNVADRGHKVTEKYCFIPKYWEETFFDFYLTSSTCNILSSTRNTNLCNCIFFSSLTLDIVVLVRLHSSICSWCGHLVFLYSRKSKI